MTETHKTEIKNFLRALYCSGTLDPKFIKIDEKVNAAYGLIINWGWLFGFLYWKIY